MRGLSCLIASLSLISDGVAAPRSRSLSPRKVVQINGASQDIPWADGMSDADIEATFGPQGGSGTTNTNTNPNHNPNPNPNPLPSSSVPAALPSNPPDSSKQVTVPQSSNNGSTGAGGGCAVVPAKPAGKQNGCKPFLKSVCFNSGYNVGMFDTIGAADSWISFGPMPSGSGSALALQAQVPMIAFASDVAQGVTLAKACPPPEWLLTFNEPDYSYQGITPTMSPEDAATQIQPLLEAVSPNTKLVAPVPADPSSDWLTKFFAACNCQSRFAAVNIHIYVPDVETVKKTLNDFHTKWNMPVWVTEIAPGSGQCALSADQVSTFMKEIYAFGQATDWIERIYWNTGNEIDGSDQNVCQSFLLKTDGTPAPLLDTYKATTCS